MKTLWLELCLRMRVLWAAFKRVVVPMWQGEISPVGRLYAVHIKGDGTVNDLGLVCTKVVTDAGVNYLVDAMQNITEPENMKFHASGTGTTAEAAGQTALVTEVATRATGSTTEGASANIYRTVGTIAYTSTLAITEHGIFSASSVGTMLDRSVFAAINVINGDSIQFTYDLTFPSGS
jgi:hypothetical protein